MATSSWADGAVDETIGSSQDRATIAAFESAHDGESPTNGTICKGSLTGVDSSTGWQYWSGWQSGQNSTTKIVITSQDDDEPDGINDASGSDALVQSIQSINNSTAFYLDVLALEFAGDYLGIHISSLSGGGELNIAKCVFRDIDTSGVDCLGGTDTYNVNIGGCLFKNTGSSAYKSQIRNNNPNCGLTVINCTCVEMPGYWGAIYAQATGADIILKNCALADNYNDIYEDNGTVTTTTTASEDGDADFTIVTTDGVDFTEPSTSDYTIPDTDSDLYEAGTAITDTWFTTLCATDFAGTSWGSTPSVGCFEYDGGSSVGILPISLNAASSVGTPSIGQKHGLTASNISCASTIGSPLIGQEHSLIASEIGSTSTVDSPSIEQIHGLIAIELSCASTVDSPELGQTHSLTASEITSTSTNDSPEIGQEHALIASELTSASSTGSPVLSEPSEDTDELGTPPDITSTSIAGGRSIEETTPTLLNTLNADVSEPGEVTFTDTSGGAYSNEAFPAGYAILTFKVGQDDKSLMIGLDQTIGSANFASPDYAFYLTSAGMMHVARNASADYVNTAYDTDTLFKMVYDGSAGEIQFYMDTGSGYELEYTYSSVASDLVFYFECGAAAAGTGDVITDISYVTQDGVAYPEIGQVHVLNATDIVSTSVNDTPVLGQEHALTVTGITSASSIDTPSIEQIHDLTATGITSASTVGTPEIANIHVLNSTGITSTPILGTPAIGQIHVLTATDITATPVVGTPRLNWEQLDIPAERTYKVDFESRTYIVPARAPPYKVPFEDRTLIVT
jgi:hypothetical protein